jgi:hypothetical protein
VHFIKKTILWLPQHLQINSKKTIIILTGTLINHYPEPPSLKKPFLNLTLFLIKMKILKIIKILTIFLNPQSLPKINNFLSKIENPHFPITKIKHHQIFSKMKKKNSTTSFLITISKYILKKTLNYQINLRDFRKGLEDYVLGLRKI